MEDKQVIVWFVFTGVMIMIILALTVIFFVTQHRKKYLIQENEILRVKNEIEQSVLRAIIDTQEEERTRISINLHDSVGAELSMLKLNLSKYIQFNPKDFKPEFLKQDIRGIDDTIEVIRGVCKDLYPKALQLYGYVRSFESVVHRLDDTRQIKASFSSQLQEQELHLEFPEKLNLYRISQEIINNIIKHAKCTTMEVVVKINDHNGMDIYFRHNGAKFLNVDAEELMLQNKGIGLKSVRSRIDLLKGKINYLHDQNQSVVEISIPFKNA